MGGAVDSSIGVGAARPATVTQPTALPAPADIARLVPVLEQLVAALEQLVAGLQQASAGVAALAPGAAGAPPAPVAQPLLPVAGDASRPARPPRPAQGGGTSQVNVASFNVLGASHTAGGNSHPSWRSGVARVPQMIGYLKKWDVDVAGLQEFQKSQRDAFARSNTGYAMAGHDDNVIVWRKDRFRKVAERSLTIPYFGGNPKQMPVVQLEDVTTGKRAWFVNVHNPASTKWHPNNERHRAEALRRERELVEQLEATGLPVFIVGDFNSRERVRDVMGAGGLATASDPRAGRDAVDWVFGAGPVQLTNHHHDNSTHEARVSDHPVIVATARY